MKSLSRVFVILMIIVAAFLIAQTQCGVSSEMEEGVDPGTVMEEVEVSAIVPKKAEELTQPVITYKEIREELRESMPDDWPEMKDVLLYDTASQIEKFSKDNNMDPFIMADETVDLAVTIVKLQPAFAKGWEGGHRRALRIAWDTYRGAAEVKDLSCHEISSEDFDEAVGVKTGKQVQRVNPFLLVSMGYRESRFLKRTEKGYVVRGGIKNRKCRWCIGAQGERGMFQFMPKGFIQNRFMPKGCSPFDRMCSVRGAAKALAHIRCMCIEEFGDRCNTDVYVGGYGLNKLPKPETARHSRGPKNARAFLCSARDDCDDLWERDHSDDFALAL